MRFVRFGNYAVDADKIEAVAIEGGYTCIKLGPRSIEVREMTVDAVLSALKRGPTPCSTCRWFAPVQDRSDGLCNANGASKFWESTKDHLGCWVSADAQAIGCPKHEEA